MMANVVRELGIFMGSDFGDGAGDGYQNWEDLKFHRHLWVGFDELDRAFMNGAPLPDRELFASRMQFLEQLIDARNSQFSNWGIKHAAGLTAWCLQTDLIKRLRNPHLISVWRDPVAVWQHESFVHNLSPEGIATGRGDGSTERLSLELAGRQYDWLRAVTAKARRPHLLVSFERSMQDRSGLIEQVAHFLGVKLTESDLNRVVESMHPTRP